MDDADLAQIQMEHQLEMKKPVILPIILATGYCLNCERAVEHGRRWCDAQCRDDWQRDN